MKESDATKTLLNGSSKGIKSIYNKEYEKAWEEYAKTTDF